MKKLISLLLVIVTLSGIVLLSSCGSDDANGPTPAATDDTQSSPADESDEVLNCSLYPLDQGTEYTVNISAVDMIGTRSEPIVYEFTTNNK